MLASQWPDWKRRTVGAFFLVIACVVLIGIMVLPFILPPAAGDSSDDPAAPRTVESDGGDEP